MKPMVSNTREANNIDFFMIKLRNNPEFQKWAANEILNRYCDHNDIEDLYRRFNTQKKDD